MTVPSDHVRSPLLWLPSPGPLAWIRLHEEFAVMWAEYIGTPRDTIQNGLVVHIDTKVSKVSPHEKRLEASDLNS